MPTASTTNTKAKPRLNQPRTTKSPTDSPEEATKEILEQAGIKIDKHSGFKLHFPDLHNQIRIQGRTRAMVPLAPILGKLTFLDGWTAECRYEADILASRAETRFNFWVADVDSLFKAAGIP